MDNINLTDLRGTDVNSFVRAYRDSLKNQYDTSLSQLKEEKRQQDANIMSDANTAGVMFSNFPERTKIQYESQSYIPSVAKANETYQTGLQSLRENAVSAYNNIKSLQSAIGELNSAGYGSGGGSGYSSGRNSSAQSRTTGIYTGKADGSDPNGIYFYVNGTPVKANTYANATGTDLNSILRQMANAGDLNAKRALAGLNNAKKQLTSEEQIAFDTLGIDRSGYGTRP